MATTTTHSPRRAPVPSALNALRILVVALVAVAGLLVTLAAVAFVVAHPLAALLFGLPVAAAVGFGVLFSVVRVGAAVAEHI